MPLLPEADPPSKRRAPVWLLILAVVVLPLVGVFGWSWFQPVTITQGKRGVAFGRTTYPYHRMAGRRGPGFTWDGSSRVGWMAVKLPGSETGWYAVGWAWR